MSYDTITVGGGFAGLAAATYLGRARRHVLVLDTGRPRNRFAATSHGFLGQDGRTPMDIATRKGHHDIVAALAGAGDSGAGAVFAILIVVILVMGVRRVTRRR